MRAYSLHIKLLQGEEPNVHFDVAILHSILCDFEVFDAIRRPKGVTQGGIHIKGALACDLQRYSSMLLPPRGHRGYTCNVRWGC
jgi:hypothetical protein